MIYEWANREQIGQDIRAALAASTGKIKKDRWKRYTLYLDGKWQPVPGVTTVISNLDKSRPLVKWAARVQKEADLEAAWKMYGGAFPSGLSLEVFSALFEQASEQEQAHQKIKTEAADLGTRVHALIEHRVREMLGTPEAENPHPSSDVATDAALYVFSGWEDWAKEVEFLPVATEFPVFSYEARYAGSPDVIGWCRHVLELVDWKTANGLYAEFNVQNVAYRAALQEMGVLKEMIPGRLVRLPKSQEGALEIEDHPVPLGKADEDCLSVFLHLRGLYDWKKEQDKIGLERWRAKKARGQAAA